MLAHVAESLDIMNALRFKIKLELIKTDDIADIENWHFSAIGSQAWKTFVPVVPACQRPMGFDTLRPMKLAP